jgi:hypothetical protein
MEIHKYKCDNCGKEKDIQQKYFGGFDTWQSLYVNTDIERHKEIHLCSDDCVITFLQKRK